METSIDVLAEIATELREIKVYLAKLAGEDPNAPKDCREKQCSYYQHYLAYGPADLTHEGFHAAEKLAEQHIRNCSRMEAGKMCAQCTSHEQRCRA